MDAIKIGSALKQSREGKGVSIQEASRKTRIRDRLLEALEAGKWEAFATQAQVRGFIRNYATFLDLDVEALLGEEEAARETGEPAIPLPPQVIKELNQGNGEFAEIGKQLRERREVLGLSLDEVEGQTRIQTRYLQWIEDGDFDAFPSPTQGRGMLNNYASFLGLEQEVLDKYGEIVFGSYKEAALRGDQMPPVDVAPPVRTRRLRVPLWMRRYMSLDIVAAVILTVILLGVFLWGVGQVASLHEAEQIPPTAPPLAELLVPTETESVEASEAPSNLGEEDTPQATESPQNTVEAAQITIQVANPGEVNLTLIASAREWVRVTVDGSVQFEGRSTPGETYKFTGRNGVLVYTGNASAFRVVVNNQDLGPLGIESEVINMLFTSAGAATPSPTLVPTIDPAILTGTAEAEAAATAVDEATPEP